MINRGGEKISPAEIDEALLRHPDVAEAAAYAIPHPRLGEEVAAAVVLKEGATATPLELREFLFLAWRNSRSRAGLSSSIACPKARRARSSVSG